MALLQKESVGDKNTLPNGQRPFQNNVVAAKGRARYLVYFVVGTWCISWLKLLPFSPVSPL
jgi:hypothetical protein